MKNQFLYLSFFLSLLTFIAPLSFASTDSRIDYELEYKRCAKENKRFKSVSMSILSGVSIVASALIYSLTTNLLNEHNKDMPFYKQMFFESEEVTNDVKLDNALAKLVKVLPFYQDQRGVMLRDIPPLFTKPFRDLRKCILGTPPIDLREKRSY